MYEYSLVYIIYYIINQSLHEPQGLQYEYKQITWKYVTRLIMIT